MGFVKVRRPATPTNAGNEAQLQGDKLPHRGASAFWHSRLATRGGVHSFKRRRRAGLSRKDLRRPTIFFARNLTVKDAEGGRRRAGEQDRQDVFPSGLG